MKEDIQYFILKGLFENNSFFRKVSGNLEERFFEQDKGVVIRFLKEYFAKYEKVPEYSVATNSLLNDVSFRGELREEIENTINETKALEFDSNADAVWLYDKTKEFANKRAMFLFIKEGAIEVNKDEKEQDFQGLEKKMREALSLNWDEDLGIDYFDESQFEEIYDQLSDSTARIPLGIEAIDNSICGGIPCKSKFCAVLVGSGGLGKCVSFINIIRLRNKKTGEIKVLPIGEFHNNIKKEYHDDEKRK